MKSFKFFLLMVMLVVASQTKTIAQQRARLEVVTKLQELNGNYAARKLYRGFLTEAMKRCPYIHNFRIAELPGAGDNQHVEWIYDVNNWDDITSFYNWIKITMQNSTDSSLIKALTPYAPSYDVGGAIDVHKNEETLVKH